MGLHIALLTAFVAINLRVRRVVGPAIGLRVLRPCDVQMPLVARDRPVGLGLNRASGGQEKILILLWAGRDVDLQRIGAVSRNDELNKLSQIDVAAPLGGNRTLYQRRP